VYDLTFVSWFELANEPQPNFVEANFGILHSDLSPKLGYGDLKQQLFRFSAG
jgi:hypothetical protein